VTALPRRLPSSRSKSERQYELSLQAEDPVYADRRCLKLAFDINRMGIMSLNQILYAG